MCQERVSGLHQLEMQNSALVLVWRFICSLIMQKNLILGLRKCSKWHISLNVKLLHLGFLFFWFFFFLQHGSAQLLHILVCAMAERWTGILRDHQGNIFSQDVRGLFSSTMPDLIMQELTTNSMASWIQSATRSWTLTTTIQKPKSFIQQQWTQIPQKKINERLQNNFSSQIRMKCNLKGKKL